MKLLVSAFLLLAPSYPATAEVVDKFEKCKQFFFKDEPPTGPSGVQYKKICQKKIQADGYEFATLYDTSNKIPVYSAYKFVGYESCDRSDNWFIEPQLDDPRGGPLMASESTVSANLQGKNQSLNGDYTNTVYDRGHLVPVKHLNSQSCVDATFTLTNAAPQHYSFNRGQWRVKEAEVAKNLTKNCLNLGFHAYIVTGVVPGNTSEPIGKGKVNVPSYFWSAYCCVDNNDKLKHSGAYYGQNVDKSNIIVTSPEALDTKLSEYYGYTFQVFSDKFYI